jgi:opacity protein-like surface antigen
MRRARGFLLMAVIALVAGNALAADGNVNFILGQRNLSDEVWEFVDLDSQPLFGVNADFGGEGWPVHVAVGVNISADTSGDLTAAIADLSVGGLWVPRKGKTVRPYLGAGVSTVGVAIDDDFDDETDQSFGFYANGGVFFRLGSHFNIGADLRMVRGTSFEVLGAEFDADYVQLGLLLGVGW